MAQQSETTATQPPTTVPATGTAAPAPKPKHPKKIQQSQQKPISKKRKFIKDGLFYAEINDYFKRELSENGYAGCEVRVTPTRTEIIIRATQANLVVGDNGKRIRELTALIQKKFKFPKKGVILFCEKVRNQGLSALAQAEAVKFRLLQGLSVRRAAYSVLKFIMDRGADGCEITISGKLRGQRAKSMKFRDGYMIHAGDAVNYYIDRAIKHVHLRQGVIGIRVKIMLPHVEKDHSGRQHIIVPKELPDKVHVKEPKDIEFEEDKIPQQQQQQRQHVHPPQDNLGNVQTTNQPIHQQQQQQINVNADNQNPQVNYSNVGQNYDDNQPYDNQQNYNQQFPHYNTNQQYNANPQSNQFY